MPNVTDAQSQSCRVPLYSDLVGLIAPGLPLMDGSRSDCEWGTDPDAPAPGIFGPGNLPTLERLDWVANMNDSYWLTNPAEPVTGYNGILGPEGTERSLRRSEPIGGFGSIPDLGALRSESPQTQQERPVEPTKSRRRGASNGTIGYRCRAGQFPRQACTIAHQIR